MRALVWWASGVALAGACGCGHDGDDDVGPADDAAVDAATDAAAEPDAGRDAGLVCSGTLVAEVAGRLLDPDGAGVEESSVGLCLRSEQRGRETFVCLRPVFAEPDGRWSVSVPEALRCVLHATVRLAAPSYATTYCTVEVDGGDASVTAPDWELLPMPADPPAWGAGDEEIVLVADDGSAVSIRPSDVDDTQSPDDVRLQSVDPTATRPCFLPEGQDPMALVVLEPESNVVRAGGLPASLRDRTGAPPGTAVSFYLLGGLHTVLDGELVQEGQWVPFAEGVVADDGTIATPDGDGLPQLGWVGVAAR